MKKQGVKFYLVIYIFAVCVAASIAGCVSPSVQEGRALSKKIYDAAVKEPQLGDISRDKLIYRDYYDYLITGELSGEECDALIGVINRIAAGKNLFLDVRGEEMMARLRNLECSVLNLYTYTEYLTEDLAEIGYPLNVAIDLTNGRPVSPIPFIPAMEKLSVQAYGAYDISMFENIKDLEIQLNRTNKEGPPDPLNIKDKNDFSKLVILESIVFTRDKKIAQMSAEMAALILSIKEFAPSILTINGCRAEDYDPVAELDETQLALYDELVKKDRDMALRDVANKYLNGVRNEYVEYKEVDHIDITGKVMVFVVDQYGRKLWDGETTSIGAAISGEDYNGILNGYLTYDPESCAQVIHVYSNTVVRGDYGAVAKGYATETWVCVIDPVTKTVSEPKKIKTEYPPVSIAVDPATQNLRQINRDQYGAISGEAVNDYIRENLR